jgi:site-specific DNA-cytosine methylase
LENVPNVLTIANGSFWRRIQNKFSNFGYGVQYKIYSPLQFGFPQQRYRLYVVAFRDGGTVFEWPDQNVPVVPLTSYILDAPEDMRLVLEFGLMARIELDFPVEYARVSEKGIASLLNYMHSNSTSFFDRRIDHKVIKCIQSLFAGTQADVVLLNNVSHGHYQPSKDELDLLAKNL